MAAAGLGLVLVGVGVAVSTDDDDPPRMEVSAGTPTAITDMGADSLTAHNSPAVVASPSDPDTLVVAARVDRPQLSAVIQRSTDGGRTWDDTQLPLPAGEVRAFAPDVAFDSAGTLYVAFLTMSDPDNNPTGVWVARSGDEGASFATPTKASGPYGYQPRLVVSGSTIHVSFVQATNAVESITNGFGPPPNPVVVATSTDSGATFGQPVEVSGDRARVGAATPFLGLEGELMVLFEDFGNDSVDFEGRSGPTHEGDFSLVLARSDDGGRTFEEVSVVDDAVKPTSRFNPYVPEYPSVAVSPIGEAPAGDAIYVAWADATNNDWDVFVRRSNDGGASWGPRVKVTSEAAASGTHQYLPSIAVAPTGRVDIAFLDRSEDEDNRFAAAALATSFDAGATWRTVSVSNKLFDSSVGPPSPAPGGADFGSRIGIVSQREQALAVWTDTQAGTVDTGRQDIYFAPVRIAPES
ncbi:MAG: hypothetical protein ACRD0N_10555 [Acidimicrobiales bacterium]